MKKFLAAILLLAGVLGIVFAFGKLPGGGIGKDAYLRVHIRADSNEEAAQAVKYKVRDEVVKFLTPVVASCEKKEEAMEKIGENLGGTVISRDDSPRDGVTLEAGVYDALILELGSGKGDNWWCVVYPPLCFTGANNVVYKSKIAEIIKKFFG